MTPHRIMPVPIDRSMPPVMMTNVVPRARMPVTVAAVRIDTRLFAVKKCGLTIEKNDDDDDEARGGEQLLERAASAGEPRSAGLDRLERPRRLRRGRRRGGCRGHSAMVPSALKRVA